MQRDKWARADLHLVVVVSTLVVEDGVSTDLLVVLLEGSEVLAGLDELTLLHALTDVPVDEGTLGEHEVELAVNALEDLGDGSGVREHGDSAVGRGELVTGDDGGLVLVDAALEASGAPVDELDGGLVLDGEDGVSDILGDDVTAVHKAARHVLALAGVALAHHVLGLEGSVGDLRDGEALAEGLLGGDDGRVRAEEEVDAGVGDQVGLELVDVNVELTLEAERGGEAGDDLSDDAVEVLVRGALDAEVLLADVIDGLVVEHEGAVGVLEESVGREDRVVGLDDRGGDLGRGVDAEVELGLLAVVSREALEEERAEARASTTTNRVEDEEALETVALVSELANAIQGGIEEVLADGVVAASVVVGGVLLARDELVGMEELRVLASADFVDDGGLEVNHDSTRNVLAGTNLREHGLETLVIRGLSHGAIGLDAVLEAVELPASITGLNAGLTNVKGNDFSHVERVLI